MTVTDERGRTDPEPGQRAQGRLGSGIPETWWRGCVNVRDEDNAWIPRRATGERLSTC